MLRKIHLQSIAALALAFGLIACNSGTQTESSTNTQQASPVADQGNNTSPGGNNRPLVVATNTVACGITKEIAAETVDLKCLIEPGADPHEYQPKPEDSKAIEQASLILYGGYNFEPGLIKLIQASSNKAPKAAINELAVPTPQKFSEDGKTIIDPHVWQNAQNGAAIAKVVSEQLAKLSPNNASTYNTNAQKFAQEVTQIDSWIKSQIATIPPSQRKLVTTHDAFGYYSSSYALPIEGALQGVSTSEAPTAKRVAELTKEIKKSTVPTIFAEKTTNPKLIEQVAKEAKVKVADEELFADGLGEKGSEGETYQKMLIANTRTIVQGLGGKYAAFQAK
jgi:manganese/iron transport system substrate-binding protein